MASENQHERSLLAYGVAVLELRSKVVTYGHDPAPIFATACQLHAYMRIHYPICLLRKHEVPSMDVSMVCFLARMQDMEDLLLKRRTELAAQQQKRSELEQQLAAEENKRDVVLLELSTVQEASQALTGSRIQLKHDISLAREQLVKKQVTARLAAEERSLQQQLDRLLTTTQKENQMQQQYGESTNHHMRDMASRMRVLQAKEAKIAAKLQQLQQQEERLCLNKQLQKFREKQAALQKEVTQLTATLTDTKQANAVACAKVAAATTATAAELQAVQDRMSTIKSEAFQMGREQMVNETRLKQLQQEGARLRQQCNELDHLTARASTTIDQLTSSVD